MIYWCSKVKQMWKNAICSTGIEENFLRFAVTEEHEAAKIYSVWQEQTIRSKKAFCPFQKFNCFNYRPIKVTYISCQLLPSVLYKLTYKQVVMAEYQHQYF